MEERLDQLFKKYLNNLCSEQEIISLLEYFRIEENEPSLRELILRELQRSEEPNITVDHLEDRLELVYANVKQYIELHPSAPVKRIKLWPRVAAAAVILIALGTAFWFYSDRIDGGAIVYANDVPAGKVGATLTLANGKKITLTDALSGQISKEAGIVITKSKTGQLIYSIASLKVDDQDSMRMNTLSTSKGETYQVILPDKSIVWLNAASSIKYPLCFAAFKERKIELVGEAYFEVARDKRHPFIVQTNQQRVQVMGTHFNVNSYVGETATKTTLLEGSVRINDHIVIKPGEQATGFGNDIEVKSVDTNDAIAWKNGKTQFSNQNIKSIMQMLERWYNIEVEYQGQMPESKFGGSVSRSKGISEVLRLLELTGEVHFKVEGRRVVVTKKY